jgi:hypothetical protein
MSFRAAFNPLIRPYLVITIGFTMVVTVSDGPVAVVTRVSST